MDFHHRQPGLFNYQSAYKINEPPIDKSSNHLSSQIKVELANKNLWNKFHGETTEMIITKLGRRMFPSVQVNIDGLKNDLRYYVFLEISLASEKRYKYVGGQGAGNIDETRGWTNSGAAEPQSPIHRRLYLHPDSPATGLHWMRQSVNFNKLKLTNNAVDHHNNVVLTSMHKYVSRIWVVQLSNDDLNVSSNFYTGPSAFFTFKETEFIAVTAYQNDSVTKLKINNNPFAKGFRTNGQGRWKKKIKLAFECEKEIKIESENENEEGENSSSIDSETNNEEKQESLDFITSTPKLHRPWIDEPKTLWNADRNKNLTTPTGDHCQRASPSIENNNQFFNTNFLHNTSNYYDFHNSNYLSPLNLSSRFQCQDISNFNPEKFYQ